MVGDQMAEEITRIGFRCVGRLTTTALKKSLKLVLATISAPVKLGVHGVKKLVENKNKVSLDTLSKNGEQVNSDEVSKSEIKGFHKYAKKYGLKYSLVRERNDPEHYFLAFRTKDTDKLNMCLTDFLKDKNVDKDSDLGERLRHAKEKAHNINEARETQKNKDRDRGNDKQKDTDKTRDKSKDKSKGERER